MSVVEIAAKHSRIRNKHHTQMIGDLKVPCCDIYIYTHLLFHDVGHKCPPNREALREWMGLAVVDMAWCWLKQGSRIATGSTNEDF
jgi:hypothetical protein